MEIAVIYLDRASETERRIRKTRVYERLGVKIMKQNVALLIYIRNARICRVAQHWQVENGEWRYEIRDRHLKRIKHAQIGHPWM